MAKSVQFPVKQPRDFDTLIRYEGRDINYVDPAGYSARRINTGGSKAGITSIYQNRTDTALVPVGKCYWVESISYGATLDGQFQVLATPYSDGENDVWGLEDHEVYRAGGKSGVLVVRKWFRELTRFQFAFQSFKPGGDTMFFATLNGVEFTGNAGLNFGANKSMLVCGASTSWYLIGDWRNNVDTFKYVPSGSNELTIPTSTAMIPNQDGGNGDNPFSGDGLWGNQLIYDFMENGKDWRWVNKSFGGSNFIRNWYGAIQSGYLNGVTTDLIMVEAGVNDANGGEWTTERRTQFKDRLAKFTEWRNRWNPSAPVVYISPVLNDDGFGVNVDTASAYLPNAQPGDIGTILDPRTAVATTAPSGSNFNTRNTWDSSSNGEYVSGSTTYYMTRIEIARQLIQEVATSSSYGGGTANNVYYIDGLNSDFEFQVAYRQETQNGSGSASFISQSGLRFAKYLRKEDIDNGISGSITQYLKDNNFVPSSFPGIVGEINYFNSGSVSTSPYIYTGSLNNVVAPIERDTQDLSFKYVNTGTNEQISGQRLHRSPMGMFNLYQNIKAQLQKFGLYDTL